MSDQHEARISSPFLESMFENRPIIARWGPSVVHIGPDSRHVAWAMLVGKGQTPVKSFVWSDGRAGVFYQKSIGSVQTNRDGVFVGRHPIGVPIVVIEDWTYLDDTSDVVWG